jgi:hypothetical protein
MTRVALRRCSCGGTPGLDGECSACKAKRVAVQRQAPPQLPRPFDGTARRVTTSHLGHDFGRMQVQDDAETAGSRRAVASRPYNVGPGPARSGT